jgi:hypothetical protein
MYGQVFTQHRATPLWVRDAGFTQRVGVCVICLCYVPEVQIQQV